MSRSTKANDDNEYNHDDEDHDYVSVVNKNSQGTKPDTWTAAAADAQENLDEGKSVSEEQKRDMEEHAAG